MVRRFNRAREVMEVQTPRVSDPELQRAIDSILTPLKSAIRYLQNRVLVTTRFTTGATLELNYPVTIEVPLASIAGVSVVKVEDISNPRAVRYESVDAAAWTSDGGTLTINFFTGLEVGTSYNITLEVFSA